ncbi:hypothetical protein Naga_100318g3 [Nannochloropsis gaditana]|uniref:Uncharacterized protein n=1 Tax=Nannochloropsis gaditana TaxID=72520 RepID=W7TP45_9STRA|nr:hypothetical protein Naga_100318g3 [Nannochloropsis gaditana]
MEDTSVTELAGEPKCLACRECEISYECMPCMHAALCKKCAMKQATGGLCKQCKRPFSELRRRRRSVEEREGQQDRGHEGR